MIAKKKKGTKAGNAYKRLNIGFTKELHETLSLIAEKNKRSLTGQIEFILEQEAEKFKLEK